MEEQFVNLRLAVEAALAWLHADPLHAGTAGLAIASLLLIWGWRRTARASADLRNDLARAQTDAARVPGLESELAALAERREDEMDGMRDLVQAEAMRATRAEAELATERRTHAAKIEQLEKVEQTLEHRFRTLATEIMNSNSEAYLGLVSERFEKHSQGAREDLDRRHRAIQALVEPLDKKLSQFDDKIGQIEKARENAYGAIQQQMLRMTRDQEMLGLETRRLVQALRAPKTRGRWGEMQLKQVFEMAGMTEHVDFVTEQQIDTEAGKRRPDAVVRIPGGKTIVVDAKTPLDAYLNSIEAETPEAQGVELKRHAAQVRTHVKQLSSKAYQDAIAETPDFIVMFIPGETFVAAAAEADPGLIEYAFENRVLIATPTTLMALVKAIAYGWQQEKMAKNAVEVQRMAKDLYDRLSTFAGHVEKVGRGLSSAVTAYNGAVGSLETRILPTARKFQELGVVTGQSEVTAPEPLEADPRRLTAPEFAGE